MFRKILDVIIIKIYQQDFIPYIFRILTFNSKPKRVYRYLIQLEKTDKNIDEILKLTSYFFLEPPSNAFYLNCYKIIEQILIEPNIKSVPSSISKTDYRDLPLLMNLADHFGRFDLGYLIRVIYCQKLEGRIGYKNTKRVDAINFTLNKELFGSTLFQNKNVVAPINPPFYLKNVHKKFMTPFRIDMFADEIKEREFLKKIKNKKIALIAPGILKFGNDLVSELKTFDEIIALNYEINHYINVPISIKISYYNSFNTELIQKEKDSIKNNGLDYLCLKTNYTNNPSFRGIQRDSHKWTIGKPNMVQVALFDILYYTPKTVKVFGANFFLSTITHNTNYISNRMKMNLASIANTTTKSLSRHNALSNFLYIENLYIKGKIELDLEARSIISNGLKCYANEMTKLYNVKIKSNTSRSQV